MGSPPKTPTYLRSSVVFGSVYTLEIYMEGNRYSIIIHNTEKQLLKRKGKNVSLVYLVIFGEVYLYRLARNYSRKKKAFQNGKNN